MPAPDPGLPLPLARPLARLRTDLQDIFGARLVGLVAHGPRVRHAAAETTPRPPINTLALVDGLTYRDLAACAQHAGDWRADGLAVPLLLGRAEFARSLDAFPVEYGDIIAHHLLVYGDDPFEGVSVSPDDLRRACEAWAKGHLIHLREGFVETGGDPRRVAALIIASASPFTGLLSLVARLRGADAQGADGLARATEGIAGLPAAVVAHVVALEERPVLDADTAMTLLPAYLDAVGTLVTFLDGWTRG
jgi:hypothetical protein